MKATVRMDQEDLVVDIPGIQRNDLKSHNVDVYVKYLRFSDHGRAKFSNQEVVSLTRQKGGLDPNVADSDILELVGVSAAVLAAATSGTGPKANQKPDKSIDAKRWAHLLS